MIIALLKSWNFSMLLNEGTLEILAELVGFW